jgi:hypothetical protein
MIVKRSKHAVGSNKLNTQNLGVVIAWTGLLLINKQDDDAQKRQTSDGITAPHLNVNLPHKHTCAQPYLQAPHTN